MEETEKQMNVQIELEKKEVIARRQPKPIE